MANRRQMFANLLIVAACIYNAEIYPIHLAREFGAVTLLVMAGSIAISIMMHRRWEIHLSPNAILGALSLILLSLLISMGAVDNIPRLIDRRTVYSVHLGLFYRAVHYVFTFYAILWALNGRHRSRRAEMGLVAILIYSTLNGTFFRFEGEAFGLMFCLSMVTILMYLSERQEGKQGQRDALKLPILLFLASGLLSTVLSPHIHGSLERWLRLGNWVLLYFLIVAIVRSTPQVLRLLLVLAAMSVLVSVAGLSGVVEFASQTDWHKALRARLFVGQMHPNAVATYLGAFITLTVGLFYSVSSLRRSTLLPVVISIGVLAGVGGLLSRAGLENPLRIGFLDGELLGMPISTLALISAVITIGAGFLWWLLRRDVWAILAVLPMLLTWFLTYSRSGAVGLFAGLLVLLWLVRTSRIRKPASCLLPKRLNLKLWSLALLSALPFLFMALLYASKTMPDELSYRLNLWKGVIDVLRHRPLQGVGLDNHLISVFCNTLPQEFGRTLSHPSAGAVRDLVTMTERVGWHSHNLVLEIGESMGLIGIGLFTWLLIVVWRSTLAAIRTSTDPVRQSLTIALLAALAALLAPHLLVLTLSRATLLPVSFWAILGMLTALGRIESQNSEPAKNTRIMEPGTMMTRNQSRSWFGTSRFVAPLLLALLFCAVRPLIVQVAANRVLDSRSQGDLDRERSALRLALRLQPMNAHLHARVGDLLDGQEAIDRYYRAANLRPLFAPYHGRLGWLYWLQNRFEKAVTEFEKAVELDEFEIDGGSHHSDLGLAYIAACRSDEALLSFRKAVQLNPFTLDKPDWRRFRKRVGLNPAYGMYSVARHVDERLSNCIKRHLHRSGSACISTGEPSIFLTDVTEELSKEADCTADPREKRSILSALASLYTRWGLYDRLEATLQVLETSVETGTRGEWNAMEPRFDIYMELGRLDSAEMMIKSSRWIDVSPVLSGQLGRIHVEDEDLLAQGIGELEFAAHSWDPSVLTSGPWPDLWRDLGMAYKKADRLEKAIEALEMARFLHLPLLQYLEQMMNIARDYSARGDHHRVRVVHTRILEVLSKWDNHGPATRRLRNEIAKWNLSFEGRDSRAETQGGE